MAQFDLNAYETVEERHARAIALHPDLRCIIINHTTPADRAQSMWVVEARVYLNADDQANDLPKATEWAFEIDGAGMANKTSALENANTSALGRSLRWALGGSKGASRQEMEKVQRGVTPMPKQESRAWLPDAIKLAESENIDLLLKLYSEAQGAKAPKSILDQIAKLGNELRAKNSVS
jgi:hypothetical protein